MGEEKTLKRIVKRLTLIGIVASTLVNSIAVIREMRLVPFGVNAVIILVGATLLPLLPLTLTIFSAEEVLLKVIQILL
jgi:hypothetical protein